MVRDIIGDGRFIEIYLDAPEEVCKTRAASGEFDDSNSEMAALSVMAAPYEAPPSPDLALKTDDLAIDQAAQKLYDVLKERKLLN